MTTVHPSDLELPAMDLIAKAVTLKSIKLSDPAAKKLLFSAKHSVLYLFDPRTSSWEKTETEGCLAIYRRANLSETVLFILNRLAPENFSCSVLEIESVQLEGDLLMVLLRDSRVMGIWLFDEKERYIALSLLQSILAGPTSSDSDSNAELPAAKSQHLKAISVNELLGGGGKTAEKTPNILDLLSKAKIKDDHNDTNFTITDLSTASAAHPPAASLEDAIIKHFSASTAQPPASLKSFTSAVSAFLQENPQLLAAAHRKLVMKRSNNNK